MNLTEHQTAYVAAVQALKPNWTPNMCMNAMLLNFSGGEVRAKAYKALGAKREREYNDTVRPHIHLWDRFAVYDMSGNYLATTFSPDNSADAIAYAKKWHPSCKDKTHLTARRLGLLETDPFYLPQAKPFIGQKAYAALAGTKAITAT